MEVKSYRAELVFNKRGNDKICGRFDHPHETVIIETLCVKCGEINKYKVKK